MADGGLRVTLVERWLVGGELIHVIQPFPTFSEMYVPALKALHHQIVAALKGPTGG